MQKSLNHIREAFFPRIFDHGLNSIFPEDHNPLHRSAVITNGVENILQTRNYSGINRDRDENNPE